MLMPYYLHQQNTKTQGGIDLTKKTSTKIGGLGTKRDQPSKGRESEPEREYSTSQGTLGEKKDRRVANNRGPEEEKSRGEKILLGDRGGTDLRERNLLPAVFST